MGWVRWAAVAMLASGCNLVTGADGIVLDDDFGDEQNEGVTAGAGGAGGGQLPENGFGGATGSTVGAATTSASAASSSSSSSAATTGSSASSSVASSSAASGGGEMCAGAGPTATELDAEEQAFLGLINQYRQQNGLGQLTACRSLNRAAQGHSEDMRDNDYFSHDGLDGSKAWDRACDSCYDLGCGPSTAMAENIAAGNPGAQATFLQWKNSPGHNKNMLTPSFKVIGIGRAQGGGTYGVYWTNVFGGSSEPSCN